MLKCVPQYKSLKYKKEEAPTAFPWQRIQDDNAP